MSYQIDLKLIKDQRIKKGFTLQQMAGRLGLDSKSNYYKRENGDTSFKSSELPVLSKVLDIDMQHFFIKKVAKIESK